MWFVLSGYLLVVGFGGLVWFVVLFGVFLLWSVASCLIVWLVCLLVYCG